MFYFCPNCWEEVSAEAIQCPTCGFDLAVADQRSFAEKLIAALDHPESATPVRAAQILAQIQYKPAIEPLLNRAHEELQKKTLDPYLLAVLIVALQKLGVLKEKWSGILEKADSSIMKRLIEAERSKAP